MSDYVDLSELNNFIGELNDLRTLFPKETKKFLQQEQTKLLKKIKAKAKEKTKKKTGEYIKSFKKSRVKVSENSMTARVMNVSLYGHFIEYGHELIGHLPDKKHLGKVEAKEVMKEALAEDLPDFENNVKEFFENLFDI